MTNLPAKRPSRINFNSISLDNINRILTTGDIDFLSDEEREYYDLMNMVRGWRARMKMPGGGRIVTKAGIIKLLKQPPYNLSDWMARRLYDDTINFFYSEEGVSSKAWANYYAEKLEKLADLAVADGRLKEAKSFLAEAAKLRGCYDKEKMEIPRELLEQQPIVIYTSDPESMGARKEDPRLIRQFIDSIPDISDTARERVKEDAGLSTTDLLKRMAEDVREFGDDEEIRDS